MRFSILSTFMVAMAAESVLGSTWFGKAAYNKWHETEQERWLSDHNIPYPAPSDRKDLETLIKSNWENLIVSPYNNWSVKQLNTYITGKGEQVKKGTEANKDALVKQVKSGWFETEDQANDGYVSAKTWVFDTWTESQLKAFLDRNNIPSPQPRTRDTLLTTVRSNYESAASALSETAAYPGAWLWANWSDSDLKSWLDTRGIPAPQHGKRDQLIAAVRRNSRLASNQAAAASTSAKASARASADYAAHEADQARTQLADKVINGWGESQIKIWADKNGIKVPQGSTKNEMLALVRKHRGQLDSNAAAAQKSASSVLGEAGGVLAQATDAVKAIVEDVKEKVLGAATTGTDKAAEATRKAKNEL